MSEQDPIMENMTPHAPAMQVFPPPADHAPPSGRDRVPPLVARVAMLESKLQDLRAHSEQNDQEIDALQASAARAERPWYRDPSVMVATLALVFSFGTTVVSARRTAQQDVHDARTELRVLFQRLNALARENTELSVEEDKALAAQLIGNTYAEQSLIAQQAAEVIQRIPKHVTPVEYVMVANSLIYVGNTAKAEELLQSADEIADNINDDVAVKRTYGYLRMISGDPEGGRSWFTRALGIWDRYETVFPNQRTWTDTQTEMFWASTEANVGNCPGAVEHAGNASRLAAQLPDGPNTMMLRQQIAALQNQLTMCRSGNALQDGAAETQLAG